MRVSLKILPPGVEHAEETDLRPEVFRIGSNLQQRSGTGSEEKIVNNLLVLQSQPRELVRDREDHVNVFPWQQLRAACGEPLFTSVGLALRTMSRTAGVERDGLMAALAALIQVSTKCCRSAVLNGEKNAEMKPRQPGSVAFDKCVAMRANDIGHLEGWLIHFLCNFRERFT